MSVARYPPGAWWATLAGSFDATPYQSTSQSFVSKSVFGPSRRGPEAGILLTFDVLQRLGGHDSLEVARRQVAPVAVNEPREETKPLPRGPHDLGSIPNRKDLRAVRACQSLPLLAACPVLTRASRVAGGP